KSAKTGPSESRSVRDERRTTRTALGRMRLSNHPGIARFSQIFLLVSSLLSKGTRHTPGDDSYPQQIAVNYEERFVPAFGQILNEAVPPRAMPRGVHTSPTVDRVDGSPFLLSPVRSATKCRTDPASDATRGWVACTKLTPSRRAPTITAAADWMGALRGR
ncbi:MAG: hypothetical protein AAB263_13780, partial [Planctomycetota bacterium]